MDMSYFPIVLGGAAAIALIAVVAKTRGQTPASKPLDVGSAPPPPEWFPNDWQTLVAIGGRVGINPADLTLVLTSESGLHPWAQNPRVSDAPVATGISQFTSASNSATGLTEAQRIALVKQPVSVQLPLVERFYNSLAWTKQRKGYPNAGVVYAANYVPGRLLMRGSSLDTVLVSEADGPMYSQNKGLDVNGDGTITIRDLVEHLRIVAKSQNYLGALRMLRQVTGNPTLSPNLPM